MSPDQARERLDELCRDLRHWETKMWMRHAENPVDLEYANRCSFCRGTGKAHFCLFVECDAEPTNECLHPTRDEASAYRFIQEQLHNLQKEVVREIENAAPSELPPDLEKLIQERLRNSN